MRALWVLTFDCGGDADDETRCKMAVPPRRFARCLRPAPLAVIASFFIFFLSFGSTSSFVILYVYLQKDFKASAIETGWVGSASWVVMNFLAPLPSALYGRFGCQRVILVGVLLSFVGLLASSFASHLWVLYITYGLAFGAGSNFVLTATINLVTSYYPGDNNIRATSLASAGQPVGLLIISGSLERACFYLGWRNGLRILSGLTLAIGLICTALSRPPSSILAAQDEDVGCNSEAEESGAGCSHADPLANGSAAKPGETTVDFNEVDRGLRGKKAYQPIPSQEGDVTVNSTRASDEHRVAFRHFASYTELDQRDLSPHPCGNIEMEQRLPSDLKTNSPSANHRLTETGESVQDVKAERSFTEAHQRATSEITNSNTEHYLPEFEPISVNENNATKIPKQLDSTFWARYVRLLRLPGHWLFFPGVITSSWAALFNVIHFVSFAGTMGIPEPTASALLIVMSGMEIASRVLVFICGNRAPVGRNLILAVVCVMAAVATYGVIALPTFAVVTIYVIILGFARGMLFSIVYGATTDTFGVDRALESYTSLLLSNGIAGALVSTIGISKDLTGNFTISLHVIAVLFLLAAILFVSAHAWRERNPLNGQRRSDVNENLDDDSGKGEEPRGSGELPSNQVTTPL